MQLRCPGTISYTGIDNTLINSYQCSEAWTIIPETSFDPSTLDPVLMAGAFGAGIFFLVPVWAAMLGVKFLIKSILSR